MSNLPATTNGNGAVSLLTDETIALMKDTICKEMTDEEFRLFIYFCRRTGLDPLAKQVHAVKRWDKKLNRNAMAIQTSIDGFRLIAQRTGEYGGQTSAEWCGADGVWRDVWLESTPPAAARVGVYRKGFSEPTRKVALWSEYKQETKYGLSPLWQKMPALMLAKCAEGLALRAAFPQELSGLYTDDEMHQADDAIEAETIDEPKRIDPPKTKMPDRPWPALDVKAALMKKAERLATEEGDGPSTAADHKRLGAAITNLGKELGPDAREKIIALVFGVTTAKDMTRQEINSIVRWVGSTKDETDSWVPNEYAVEEGKALVALYDELAAKDAKMFGAIDDSIGDVIGDGLDAMGQPIGEERDDSVADVAAGEVAR